MNKWVISVRPSAELQIVDMEPTVMDDGATVQRWKTTTGKVFAKRVESSGLVKWFQQVEE